MDCKLLKTCPFFAGNLRTMPVTSGMLKERFCKGEFDKCARFIVAQSLGREKVPETLYPLHFEDAEKLLREAEVNR